MVEYIGLMGRLGAALGGVLLAGGLLLGCPSGGGVPVGSWSGKCVGPPEGWGTVEVQIRLRGTAQELGAEGQLQFIGRKTQAELVGAQAGEAYQLSGKMTEVGGLGTTWKIAAAVQGLQSDRVLRGALTEVLDAGGETPMCTFAFPPSSGE